MNYLILKWYLPEEPWGETSILAGSSDPHEGTIVCENEFARFNPKLYDVEDIDEFVRGIMKHIVDLHNRWVEEEGRVPSQMQKR